MKPEDWEAAGYRRFKQKNWNNADFGLQKRVLDDSGDTKYHITVWAYDWSKYPDRGGDRWGFMPYAQFNASLEGGITTNVELAQSSETSIEDIEAYLERLWVFLGGNYYSRSAE